jgi:uncharacterized spore protein YtfJ
MNAEPDHDATAERRPRMDAADAMNELAQVPERTSAAHCFGAPLSLGDRAVIPVAEVAYGVGLGWGGGADDDGASVGSGGGGGAGGKARGIAVIELSPDGVQVHPIYDQTAITLAGIRFASAATALASRTLLKLLRG